MRHIKSLVLLVPLAGALVPSIAFAQDDDAGVEVAYRWKVKTEWPIPIDIDVCGNGDCPTA